MYLGLLTVGLGNMAFEDKVEWAARQGFQTIEVGCWPVDNVRDYSSTDIDVSTLTVEKANVLKELLQQNNLTISALAYYDNNLDADPVKRKFINNHLRKCIDAAVLLGTDKVGTFIGRDISKTLEGNLDEMERVFGELVEYAESKEIKIIIENCQMDDWLQEGMPGTISFTPQLWGEMFKRIPNKNFGLNYDPSHLLVQLIDYHQALFDFKDRIFHVHAKDAEVIPEKLKQYGIHNVQIGDGSGRYWRYRMPGSGQVEWKRVFENLKAIGYNGVVSLEHEDSVFEGTEDKLKSGISLGRAYLESVLRH